MANDSQPTQQQVGEACEKVVNDYRDGKTTLEEAIAAITDTIPYDRESPRVHGNAVAAYLRILSKHDVEKATATLAGIEQLQGGEAGPPNPPEPPRHELDRLEVEQRPDHTRITPEGALASALWVVATQLSQRELSPSLQATAKFLANSRRFLAQYQASIHSTPGRPSIPDSEWTNILCGRAVDLDKVLASQIGAVTQEIRTRIADAPDLEIVQRNGGSSTSRKVSDASDWYSAWEPARAATAFVFPHRRKELDDWTRYISNMFTASARTSDAQRRIIDFDRCIRIVVAQRGDLELTDIHDFEFKRIELQCLHAAGAHADARSSIGPARTARRRPRTNETCRRFNSGHQHDALACKYTHACDGCGGVEPRTKCSKCKGRA